MTLAPRVWAVISHGTHCFVDVDSIAVLPPSDCDLAVRQAAAMVSPQCQFTVLKKYSAAWFRAALGVRVGPADPEAAAALSYASGSALQTDPILSQARPPGPWGLLAATPRSQTSGCGAARLARSRRVTAAGAAGHARAGDSARRPARAFRRRHE